MDIGQILAVVIIFLLISMMTAAIIHGLFLIKFLSLVLIFLAWGVLVV